jgi:hypothetical protein
MWITGNDVNGVRMFHLYYIITLMAYLCSQWTPNIESNSLFVPKTGWKCDSLQIMKFVNVWSKWSMVHLKTRFETWITLNDVNGVSLFHLSYLITLVVYLRSQQTPNGQIKYFMCDWSIFTVFVLNRVWKRDSLQIRIFVHVCSTWVIFELKTSFEMGITGNDLNGVRLFHLPYLITLMAYLCSQWSPNIQNNRLFVLKTGWKNHSLQLMKFVNVRHEAWII